jgi:glycosyltransferase involved in cell wall biosynthesis
MIPERSAPVAVIIPCFQCATTIERAVRSVIEQTLIPAEIILIDDASGDHTWDVLCRLRDAYPMQVRLIRQETNRGAAAARNAGMRAATQSYLAFLDSDDAWHPNKIEIQYSFMKENLDVVLCGHRHRQLEPGAPLPDWAIGDYMVSPIYKARMLLSNRFVTPSAMLRRDTNLFFVEEQRHMEDHMLWLDVMFKGGRVTMLSADLAAIYKKPFGVSGLSSQMWHMERSELGNYLRLYRVKSISAPHFGFLTFYSLLKFLRRLLIARWNKHNA